MGQFNESRVNIWSRLHSFKDMMTKTTCLMVLLLAAISVSAASVIPPEDCVSKHVDYSFKKMAELEARDFDADKDGVVNDVEIATYVQKHYGTTDPREISLEDFSTVMACRYGATVLQAEFRYNAEPIFTWIDGAIEKDYKISVDELTSAILSQYQAM